MATYLITLHALPAPRGAGEVELDRRTVDAKTDLDLTNAVIDFIRAVEILRDGDVIRIQERAGE